MFLDEFFSEDNGSVIITPEQASHFAKDVARDFNPLHNTDAKRFCVPGDLLFSMVLAKYGLSQKMSFTFTGMVGRNAKLNFPQTDAEQFAITGDAGKSYLEVERSGELRTELSVIEPLIRDYVAFSGHNFPHILVPLMAEQKVMLNPDRPLVIYDCMSFDLDHLNFDKPSLTLAKAELDVSGKRGESRLYFDILGDGKKVGTGFKRLRLSGLREYDQQLIGDFIESYLKQQADY